MGIIKSEKQKEKRLKKNEESLRGLWGIIKWTTIHIVRILEREGRKRERGREVI